MGDHKAGHSAKKAKTRGEPLKLFLGCGWYDRTEPLRNRTVQPRGIDLRVETVDDPRSLFDRLTTSRGFDVAEFSISEYIKAVAEDHCPFIALPVFISRMFRHGFICINAASGIRKPKDLRGRRIGVPLYTMSAAIWCRGLLRDEFGVDLSEVTWVEGAMDAPGSHGVLKDHALHRPAKIERNTSDLSLTELLERGEIDATLGALMPSTFGSNPGIVRLFPNVRSTEIASYRATGIHPIMHLLVVRREVVKSAPWVLDALQQAFLEAKSRALERLYFTGAPKSMLPLLHAEVEETRAIFGHDPWPDGIEANKNTLERLLTYMLEDGIIERRPTLNDLFLGPSLPR